MIFSSPHINDLLMWIGTFSKSAAFFPVQLLENMTDVIRKGILEAEQQLQKASEEKLMEEVTLCFYLFHTFLLKLENTHTQCKKEKNFGPLNCKHAFVCVCFAFRCLISLLCVFCRG